MLERLNNYFSKLEKSYMDADYWLRFEAREAESIPVKSPQLALQSMYPEVPESEISITTVTEQEVERKLIACLSCEKAQSWSFVDQSQHLIDLIKDEIGDSGIKFFKVKCTEESHPTPGIYWDFWFLGIGRINEICVSFSCGAND